MKAFEMEEILNQLCQDITKTSNPLNASDNVIYLRAILNALQHVSKQIEELLEVKE